MPKLLPWPNLTGAQDTIDRIVIGSDRSRSQWSRTRFVLYNPINGDIVKMTAGRFAWKRDPKTIAILTEGLRQIVNSKVDVPFDRGAAVAQVVDCTLVMYEAGYRGALWPRYWWPLHLSCPGFPWALNEAILMETLRPDTLVAYTDNRPCARVDPHLPHDSRWQGPRWLGNLDDWVTAVLAQKGAADR
jgi:hypothetical protein